jgi:hypothetical protein
MEPANGPAQTVSGRPVFVIHIQDAHANPEAQTSIKNILEFLNQSIARLQIGVEGTAGPLHPEYFDVFPGYPDAGEAIINDLLEKGELSGAEYFAWLQYQKLQDEKTEERDRTRIAPVTGLEDLGLYRQNYEILRNLLSARPEILKAMEQIRSAAATQQSRTLNPDLREFLREKQRRKSGRFGGESTESGDLPAYLDYLGRQAQGALQIDLEDPLEEVRFSNLVRYFRLKKSETQLDRQEAASEWTAVMRLVRLGVQNDQEKALAQSLDVFGRTSSFLSRQSAASAAAQNSVSDNGAFYARKLLERLWQYCEKNGIHLAEFPGVLAVFRLHILQAELEIEGLLPEVEAFETILLGHWAKSEPEKQLVRKLDNIELLDRLLRLELTPDAFPKVLYREQELRREVRQVTREVQKGLSLEKVFDAALEFYRRTRDRDRVLAAKALALAPQNDPAGPAVIVLVTGGFHSPGIEAILRSAGIPYFGIQPRIREADQGERYVRVMGSEPAGLQAYFKTAHPFATRQESLFFQQIVEVAAPVLIRRHKLDPTEIPDWVARAVAGHPVFSGIIIPETAGDGAGRFLRLIPVPEAVRLSAQNSTLMPPEVSGDVEFMRALGTRRRDAGAVELTWNARAGVRIVQAPNPLAVAEDRPGLATMAAGLFGGLMDVTNPSVAAVLTAAPNAPVSTPEPFELKNLPKAGLPKPERFWDFFPEGAMTPELNKQLLAAVPLAAPEQVDEVGPVILHFINATGEAFSPRNPSAAEIVLEFRGKIEPFRERLVKIAQERPDTFSLVGAFFSALEGSGHLELEVTSGRSTAAYREWLLPRVGSFQVVDPAFPVPLQTVLRKMAVQSGVGFSPRLLTELFPRGTVRVSGWESPEVARDLAVRLWILQALAHSQKASSQPEGLGDEKLAGMIAEFLGEGLSQLPAEQNFLHVQVPALSRPDMDALADDLIPVLAALAATRVRLRLNVALDRIEAPQLQEALLARAKASGVVLAEGQLQVTSALGRTFASIATSANEGGRHFALGEEGVIEKVTIGGRSRIIGRCRFPMGSDSKTITAHTLTLVKNLLQAEWPDRYEIKSTDKAFPGDFAAAFELVKKFLAEVLVRAAA